MHEVWREELNSIKRLLMNLLLRKRDSRFGEEARRRTATWYTKAEPLPLAPTFLELIKLLLDVKRVPMQRPSRPTTPASSRVSL
mmetsp:Transcript_24414/g.52653  ORF Transcript_24414/g.52653 Transcript_24414/m.52653 type:complete len:84 (-) Transcript_24414:304-555(-)